MTALEGGCRCGHLRYRVAGTPFHATLCHCRDCRRSAAAPAVAWFSLRPGELLWTGQALKSYASSPGITRSFCPECGTPLTYRDEALNEVDVTLCSLDDPEQLPLGDHTQAAGRLSWLQFADGLPHFARSRADEARRDAS